MFLWRADQGNGGMRPATTLASVDRLWKDDVEDLACPLFSPNPTI